MKKLPNIIFVITDQQRFDTIAATGASWMQTPNLDRLVKEGVSFNNCFVNSPVCVSSRASLFTGKYPHQSGTFSNFHPWEPTWVQWLADIGYHCVNIGKMHTNPYDIAGGFHQRIVVENKDRPLFLDEHERAYYDDWDRALHARGLEKPTRYVRHKKNPEAYKKAMGAFVWEHDEDMHSDNFVGDTANWWLKERQSEAPLFLQIGFPGPHPPYDPTARWLDHYENINIPVPDVTDKELAAQPPAHAAYRDNIVKYNQDAVAWRYNPTKEELLRVRRHYAANTSMIDEKIGVILKFSNDNVSEEIGKNICKHIAASSPKSLSEDDLDQNLIENEKSILKEQLKDSGKQDDIISKMIDGKIKEFFEENVLLNQKFVMDPSTSINSYLESSSKNSGSEIKIDKFIRYELGE